MKKGLLLGTLLFIGALFLETSVLLLFSMMPTIAAYSIDKTPGRSRTICVGFMNFAGCFPFLLKFWMDFGTQTMENVFSLIADTENIVIIYLLAAGGYAIDIAITGITSSLIIQRDNGRLKKIISTQNNLEKFWGEKVTGRFTLDEYGFPVEKKMNSGL